jgi:hypothetical protein
MAYFCSTPERQHHRNTRDQNSMHQMIAQWCEIHQRLRISGPFFGQNWSRRQSGLQLTLSRNATLFPMTIDSQTEAVSCQNWTKFRKFERRPTLIGIGSLAGTVPSECGAFAPSEGALFLICFESSHCVGRPALGGNVIGRNLLQRPKNARPPPFTLRCRNAYDQDFDPRWAASRKPPTYNGTDLDSLFHVFQFPTPSTLATIVPPFF